MPTILAFKNQPATDFLLGYKGLNALGLILSHSRTTVFWILNWLN